MLFFFTSALAKEGDAFVKSSKGHCEGPGESLTTHNEDCWRASQQLKLKFDENDKERMTGGCCVVKPGADTAQWETAICDSVLRGETDYETLCYYINPVARAPEKFVVSGEKECEAPVTSLLDCMLATKQLDTAMQPLGHEEPGCCLTMQTGGGTSVIYAPANQCGEVVKEMPNPRKVCYTPGLTTPGGKEDAWASLFEDVRGLIRRSDFTGRCQGKTFGKTVSATRRRRTCVGRCDNVAIAVGAAVAYATSAVTVEAGKRAQTNPGAKGLVLVTNLEEAAFKLGLHTLMDIRAPLPTRRRAPWTGAHSVLGEHLFDVFSYGDITGAFADLMKETRQIVGGLSEPAAGVVEEIMNVVLCKIMSKAGELAGAKAIKAKFAYAAINKLLPSGIASKAVSTAEKYVALNKAGKRGSKTKNARRHRGKPRLHF